nr:hypothetical protein [Microtetraspora fusca]
MARRPRRSRRTPATSRPPSSSPACARWCSWRTPTAGPATIAANAIPERIARVVYLAGLLPEPGKSLFDITPAPVVEAITETVQDGRIPVMSDEIIDAGFGEHGLTPEDRTWLRARGVGQPIGTYQDPAPADLSAVERLPRTYIACAGDPGDPPGLPGHDMITLNAGHWPMINAPAELARVLDKVARS